MRHLVDGRKFGRRTSTRLAMFQALANSLIQKELIFTTVAKAKETRRVVDRLITLGKSGTLNSRRLAFARTRDEQTVQKLFTSLAERYSKRNGGYTRVLRVDGTRWGDGAETAIIELVDRPIVERKKKAKKAASAKAHDHDHDHDHDHHDHDAPKAKKTKAPSTGGKISASKASGKAGASRTTPTKSGGGRSSSGS